MTVQNGSTPFAISGVINSTYSCSLLTLLSFHKGGEFTEIAYSVAFVSGVGASKGPPDWPVEWDAVPVPPARQPLDLSVTAATFLGAGKTQFVPTGVAIVAAPAFGASGGGAWVAVAGNGAAPFGGMAPTLLLGANASANGTLAVLHAPAVGVQASGVATAAVIKLGDRIDHVRANAAGDVAVAGSFGVAVLRGLGQAGATPTVLWHDYLSQVEPGTCGVCCNDDGSGERQYCRVDIADDGVVVASFAADSAGGWLWGAYDSTGMRFAHLAQPAARLVSVFVDATSRQLGAAWFYVSNTGQESMIMPRLQMFTYPRAGGGGALAAAYTALPWDATVYRQPGPCDGNVADGRVQDVRFGRETLRPRSLLFAGRSDGGNSPFYCGLRNVTRVAAIGAIDEYTSPYDMQAQAITNMLKLDPADGETVVGQIQLVRLGADGSGGGNTLLTYAAQTDEAGTLYELQAAGYVIPQMGNLTVNGIRTAGPADSTPLLVLNAALRERLHWTGFASQAQSGGGAGGPVELDVRGGAVAFTLTTNADMVVSGELPGMTGSAGGAPVGYLVLMPTVAAHT